MTLWAQVNLIGTGGRTIDAIVQLMAIEEHKDLLDKNGILPRDPYQIENLKP